MYGMDPIAYLDETNPLRRVAMEAIARKAHENNKVRDQNLATRIVNGVAQLIKAK